MKVYVVEKPESCLDCKFCNKENYCCWLIQKDVREYRDDCPLKTLKDHDRAVKQHAYKKGYNDMRIQYELGYYTKQVRKEVMQEIKEIIESDAVKYLDFDRDEFALDYQEFKDILNKIEQGEKK